MTIGESVLLPARPPRSRAARFLGWIAIPTQLTVIVVDSTLRSAGMTPDARPFPIQVLLLIAIIAPGALWWFAPLLGRLPGLGWLIDDSPLSLTLDHAGFTLRHGPTIQSGTWAEVARLVVFEGWPPSGVLVLRDGSRLHVPSELVMGMLVDGRRTSLLDEVDRVRPALAQRDAQRQAARTVSLVVVAIVAILGLIGVALLSLR